MKIDIVSVQPKMFEGFLNESIVARAQAKGACDLHIYNLRDFTHDKHKKVDDKPFGGGPGMLMMCGPWFEVIEHLCSKVKGDGEGQDQGQGEERRVRVIMTSPAGKKFTQRDAEELAKEDHLVFMCGHYEGFDARIETLVTDKFSIGDFVLTGGELPAAVMTDSIVRLLPGVLGGGIAATQSESFGEDGLLECPQYTQPQDFRGMKVPEVLLSGDHKKIEAWRKAEALKLTKAVRPDMIDA
ncbi:MAG: tRNA (guanosine(37)-N1)-methyltransferase TrmD [Kiritimatiellae bacterium]|nr:tRNA (guanosine(37)-N1)-methyltransferase TrmD [Kiritimatiellia bacterium]